MKQITEIWQSLIANFQMENYYVPLIIALIFSIVLSYLFLIRKHEIAWERVRIEEIENSLPGLNCGLCSYLNCHDYADAIMQGKSNFGLCKIEKIEKKILAGKSKVKNLSPDPSPASKKYDAHVVSYDLVLLCGAEKGISYDKFDYDGISTCKAAAMQNNGYKKCEHACLGFGDCAIVCPVNAITTINGLPSINEKKCTLCGECLKACPKKVISKIPKQSAAYIACNANDLPDIVDNNCVVGCNSCLECIKVCEPKAITIIDNHVTIDYSKCTNCKKCIPVCKRKIIKERKTEESHQEKKEEPKDKK